MAHQKSSDQEQMSASKYRDSDSFRVEAAAHTFTFYPEGSERLRALVELIERAEHSLELFYYEYLDDHTGQRVLDALVEAVRRGVKVSLILDGFGNEAPLEFFDPLTKAGGHFGVFSPHWNWGYLIRNHQKFAVADKARVMTGGANISNPYYDAPDQNGWCDLGVVIEGDVAHRFSEWFDHLSQVIGGKGPRLRQLRRLIRQWDPGQGDVQLLLGGPLLLHNQWSNQFKKDMASAQQLDMVTAYFGPPRSFRRAMSKIFKRGKIRLISAGKSDLSGTIDAARLYYKELIKGGSELMEFQPTKLHMKLMVVDDISYFGSANLDRRSIHINIELMVRIKDQALADRLRTMIDHLGSASLPIDQEWYARNAGFWARLRWRFYYWISMIDYHVSRSVTPED